MFMLGQPVYEAVKGRVPLTGWSWRTTGCLRGSAATAVIAAMIFASVFFIFAPDAVIRLVATTETPDH